MHCVTHWSHMHADCSAVGKWAPLGADACFSCQPGCNPGACDAITGNCNSCAAGYTSTGATPCIRAHGPHPHCWKLRGQPSVLQTFSTGFCHHCRLRSSNYNIRSMCASAAAVTVSTAKRGITGAVDEPALPEPHMCLIMTA